MSLAEPPVFARGLEQRDRLPPALHAVGEHYLHNTLRRNPKANGLVLYSRDSLAFGDDEPGFTDPLIHYLGGGAHCPPEGARSAALSCYGMSGDAVMRYYTKGMILNHQELLAERPQYVENVRRIYTHQASPALVESFAKLAGLSSDKAPSNARRYGNLVSPCTAKMLHDDLAAGHLAERDQVCVSVVGAGPERGAFMLPVAVAEIVRPGA